MTSRGPRNNARRQARGRLKWTILFLCSLLLGCVHLNGSRSTEKSLRLALCEAFQQEDDIPSDRNISELKNHKWSLEMTLRSVHLESNEERILPLFELLEQQLAKSDFVDRVERITEEVGCSKVLLIVALQYFGDVDFDFYETEKGELNPRYRYSQTLLDERAIYPGRLPIRPRWKANSR